MSVKEIRDLGTDALYTTELAKHMKRLEKASLPNRIDNLHAVCKPGSREILPNYKYDHERLKAFDKLRHDIVHGTTLGVVLEGTDQEIEFVRLTNNYLSALVTTCFDFTIDPNCFMGALEK